MRFMKMVSGLLARLLQKFKGIKVRDDLVAVEDLVVEALPYLDIAAKIACGLLPVGSRLVVASELAVIHTAFPGLFDGTVKTHEEFSAYILGVAAHLLEMRCPSINTTVARTAVQLAYLVQQTEKKQRNNYYERYYFECVRSRLCSGFQ